MMIQIYEGVAFRVSIVHVITVFSVTCNTMSSELQCPCNDDTSPLHTCDSVIQVLELAVYDVTREVTVRIAR